MNLSESSWNLAIGTRLFNPYVPSEQAEIASAKTLDRTNSADRTALDTVIRNYGGDKPYDNKLESYWNDRFIPVNTATDADKYVHLLRVKIVSGQRKGTELVYAAFSPSQQFNWQMDPKNTGRSIDKFVRLPTSSNEIVRGQAGGAGYYWQPFVSSPNVAKARDRLKPTNISGITSRDITDAVRRDNEKLLNAIQNSNSISVSNIKQIINTSRARREGRNAMRSAFPQVKKQYLADLIGEFIDKPGNPSAVYPVVVVDDTTPEKMVATTGIENPSSITVDFMEIVHPIALVSGNTNGNAQRMILEFLGANSYEQLMRNALISYGTAGNTPLVDSYIYNKTKDGQVKRLHISSKGEAGAAAKVSSLQIARKEVLSNPTSREMFRKEILMSNDINYITSYRFIRNILDNSEAKKPSYLAAFELLPDFQLGDDSDLEKAESLVRYLKNEYKLSKKFFSDEDEDEEIKEATQRGRKPDPRDIVIPNRYLNEDKRTSFSPEIVEAFRTAPKHRNQFVQLVNGIWKRMAEIINSNDAFGNICVWLFNHSATVQINTYSNIQRNQLILTNIVATWPTQLVDRVELLALDGQKNVNFKLLVNGYPQDLASTEDTSSILSNRDDISNTDWNRPSGADTVKDVSQWANPEHRRFNTRIMRSNATSSIESNQALQYEWAGSNMTYQEMLQAGLPREWLDDIAKYRKSIASWVVLSLQGPIRNPNNTRESIVIDTQFVKRTGGVLLNKLANPRYRTEALQAIFNPQERQRVRGEETPTAGARAAAFSSLLQLARDNPKRYEQLLRG